MGDLKRRKEGGKWVVLREGRRKKVGGLKRRKEGGRWVILRQGRREGGGWS